MATNPEVFDFDIGDVTGEKGDTGNGIKSIELLSTSGLNKTYRITMTDDTTFDFVVTDGNGITGATFDAQTNALTLTFDNGTSFTTPSLKGVKGDTGNGISRIEKTGTVGLVDTYTVTYTDGQTFTYTVTNGADGVSPEVTVTPISGGHTVEIEDADGVKTFDVLDGEVTEARLAEALATKAPVILETASGAIASFSDGADSMPVKKLVAQIEPVQDLHGYDNPWPAGGGKNKLDYIVAWSGVPYNAEVGTVLKLVEPKTQQTVSGDTVTFTTTSGWAGLAWKTPILASGSYTVHIDVSQVPNSRMSIYTADGATNAIKTAYASTAVSVFSRTVSVDDGDYIIVAEASSAAGTIIVKSLQVESGSTATSWSPYSNECPISGWTGANIYQAGLPKGYTYANYITVNNAISIPTDIDFNAHDIEVICVHQPLVYKQYGSIYSAAYKGETYNVTRLIFNTGLGTYLFNNATIARVPGHFVEPESSFIKTVNRFGYIDVNNRTITGNQTVGSNTDVTAFTVGSANISVRYKYIIVKKTDASGGQRLLVLVACRNADGIAGLYDLVNGAFWTTASSSDTTATGDAPSDLSVLYNVTLPVNWEDEAGTVYGGTRDITSGKLAVTMKALNMGSLLWYPLNPDNHVFYTLVNDKQPNSRGIICSCYKYIGSKTNSEMNIAEDCSVASQDSTGSNNYAIKIKDSRIATASDAATILNGQTLVYLLESPIEYTLPANELTTMYGTNNIWADTGDIQTCEYAADTKLYIDRKIAEIQATILENIGG